MGPNSPMSVQKLSEYPGMDFDDEAIKEYNIMPVSLNMHTTQRHFTIQPLTLKEFADLHGGVKFDLSELVENFCKACPDAAEPFDWETANYSIGAVSKIIYSIGPESRQVKKGNTDKTWKLTFPKWEDDKVAGFNHVFICTFKNGEPTDIKPIFQDSHLILTLKQAGLIAIHLLEKIIDAVFVKQPETTLLTPLAGAVFSKDDIEKIAKVFDMKIPDVVKMINASCQSGGHHLPKSNAAVAFSAVVCATRNIKDEKIRHSIIHKTIKQYMSVNKEFNDGQLNSISIFAHGGLPSGMDVKSIINKVDNAKIAAHRMAKGLAYEVSSNIDIIGN